MQFLFALIVYVSAAAAGVKLLAVVAHTAAVSASHTLQLAPATSNPIRTLVERRLMAQAAPVISKPLARVTALEEPETPLALMAVSLDRAETAYEPVIETAARVPVQPARHARHKNHKGHYAMASLSTPHKAAHRATKIQVASRMPQAPGELPNTSKLPDKRAKNKPAPATIAVNSAPPPANRVGSAKPAGPSRFAIRETPGYLMFKGLLQQPS